MYHVTEIIARKPYDAGPTVPRHQRQQEFVLVRTREHPEGEWWPADSRELDWGQAQ